MLLKGRNDDVLPPPSRLDAVVAHLSAEGDHRHVITFVERWARDAPPSQAARLAQARALLALRQVDRAWIRLKEIVEGDAPSIEATRLAAELFIARGWPTRARELLGRVLTDHPDDDGLQALWDAASTEPVEPATPDRAWIDAASVEDLIALAEQHLAVGHTLTARGLLERVSRDHPHHPRVADLLWAVEGDFDAGPASLAELTRRWLPRTAEPTALAAEDEHTESITQEDARRALADADDEPAPGDTAFPSLFRGQSSSDPEGDDVTEEVTSTAGGVASPLVPFDADATDDDEGGDTRIVRVMRRDGQAEAGPMHRTAPPPDRDFDLEAYRAEMGMESLPLEAHLASDFGADLEDEDDDLVVLTRRERGRPTTAKDLADDDPSLSQIGREVAHLLGGKRPDPPAPPVSTPDPAVSTAVPAASRDRTAAPDDDDEVELEPLAPPRPRPRRRRRARGPLVVWAAVLVLLLALGLVGSGMLAALLWALGPS